MVTTMKPFAIAKPTELPAAETREAQRPATPPPRNEADARRDIGLAELQEKLNAAMQKLSDVHRMVVTLHDVQGLSHEEIADIMECNVGTVRSRLFYARQQLQAYLSDYLK